MPRAAVALGGNAVMPEGDDGEFPPGSMVPKVVAYLWFLDAGGERAIVCRASDVDAAVAGESRTRIG